MSGYMMNFRTQVERPEKVTEIRYSDRLLLLGSCFAENIGKLLLANKFCCDVNPYGILYNPLSIAKALEEMLEGKIYSGKDLLEADGMWHSWMHHSNFSSDSSAEECLHRINGRLIKASESLASTEWLIVTWGTAFVYEHEGQVVGNCHKQPERLFVRRRLSVDEIVTLASIVELEGASANDREGVAGVFINRLNDGWTLGSDVTTYYYLKIDDFKQSLNGNKNLYTCDNAYNTRCTSFTGLPVGPISNPGNESIDASINYDKHDFYYFVADWKGKTYLNKNEND